MLLRHSASLPRLFSCKVRLYHAARAGPEDTRWPGWQVVVGIEVHSQIKSRQKLFSSASTSELGEVPNTHVSLHDAAFPGALPRLNRNCVDLALRTSIALRSQIQRRSAFDRKHYFYPDLPAGYQITQHYAPLAKDGKLKLQKHDLNIGIKQIQLEQDTAKSTFDPQRHISHVDLNRAGTGLMEIVSEPDMRSPEEAADFATTLQALLRSIGSSDGNMEQGSFRCDVNVSVNRHGSPLGTRCEIKNMNSVKFMTVAIASEVHRHIDILANGGTVAQETRGFDEDTASTFKLRSKEDAPDYRYMPDPNLPPLLVTDEWVNRVRESMPELPDATSRRLQAVGLPPRDIGVLMAVDSGREVGLDGELGHGAVAYFDELSAGRDPKTAVNWMIHELLGLLSYWKISFQENPVSVRQLGELIDMVQQGIITGPSAKLLLRHMVEHKSREAPSALGKSLSLLAMDSEDASLNRLCTNAISALPGEAQSYRRGNVNAVNRLVGRVMKESRGRLNAVDVRRTLEELLRNN